MGKHKSRYIDQNRRREQFLREQSAHRGFSWNWLDRFGANIVVTPRSRMSIRRNRRDSRPWPSSRRAAAARLGFAVASDRLAAARPSRGVTASLNVGLRPVGE